MAERRYTLGPRERDRMILDLRGRGASLSTIAKRVGMSAGGVSRALGRLTANDDEEW